MRNIMRALVIDDSKAMRALLGRLLGEIGFSVDQAGNGREGLEHLQAHGAPDVVLVDWNMPEMSGFEFVQAVRANRDYDAVRLIMVTTETEMTRVVKALGAGLDAYVMKPFTKEAVVEQLERIGFGAN
jgi:two-component system, chemotaxis family, chemotaxis protein CheY